MIQRLGHSPYIEIYNSGQSKSGVTQIWTVRNIRTSEDIGIIRWHGPWRGYCFEAPEAAFYDEKCLQQIADFIKKANEIHRDAPEIEATLADFPGKDAPE